MQQPGGCGLRLAPDKLPPSGFQPAPASGASGSAFLGWQLDVKARIVTVCDLDWPTDGMYSGTDEDSQRSSKGRTLGSVKA